MQKTVNQRRNKRPERGFLSWNSWGSRMTEQTADGLRSIDLGTIAIEDAQKKAWLHKLVLLVDGRIYRKGHPHA